MGLGSFSTFGLAEPRIKAIECRRLACDGIDPIEARRTERARVALNVVKTLTFKACAEPRYPSARRRGYGHRRR
jgi:hypothetical protein